MGVTLIEAVHMDKMSIYRRLPVWAQNMACSFEGGRIVRTRYGEGFRCALAEYESRDAWSFERMCEYRDARLREMVRHAYDTVPYYKRLFDEGGISPDSIRTLSDLSALPILTKDTVKANREQLISTAVPESERRIHATGGTTGAGLSFVTTEQEETEQWAVWWRYRRRFGMDTDVWCGNFGGKVVADLSQTKPPFWRVNRPGKQYFYSGYHICRANAPAYAEHMKSVGLQWIHGYPSNLSGLAECLNDLGITVPMKWVSTGAENLYDHQRKSIEKAFGTTPYQHYGLTEGVANISMNTSGRLAVDEDYCCVEFLPSDEPDVYRIIGTTLTRRAMPLLRYDTGDLAVIRPGEISGNGRAVEQVSGRTAEYVELPGGARVGTAAISLIINRFDCISTMQIVQRAVDALDVNIITSAAPEKFPTDELQAALHERFGSGMQCTVNFVDSLRKTKSGKQRLVISEMERGK